MEPMERPNPVVIGLKTINLSNQARQETDRLVTAFGIEQKLERYKALARHYEIDLSQSDPVFALLDALARDFVPGFRYRDEVARTKPGKPKGKVKIDNGLSLLMEVTKLAASKKMSVAGACAILSRTKPWSGFTPRALNARFAREKKRLAVIDSEHPLHSLYDRIERIAARDEQK